MSFYILGDVHGEAMGFSDFLNSDSDYCVQLGDFGFIWNKWDVPYNKFLNKFESEYPNKKIFTVLGNHENYDLINRLPETMVFGAKARQIRQNIFAIERGEILTLEGLTILCIGGADSTDKATRMYDQDYLGKKTWWAQETIQQSDIDNALSNIKKYSGKVNIVCSHAEPYNAMLRFFSYPQCSQSELLLKDLFEQINFDIWFGGHLHMSLEIEIGNKIIKVLNINEYIITD